MFGSKKTLDSVLAAAQATINDLNTISDEEVAVAIEKEKEAQRLLDIATVARRRSAHANIVSTRMTSLITVSDEEIAATVSGTVDPVSDAAEDIQL